MTITAFKEKAGVETLQFRPCHKNKDVERCITPIGVVFKSKDFNLKSKVKDVEASFDQDGNQVYWLTNTPVSSEL